MTKKKKSNAKQRTSPVKPSSRSEPDALSFPSNLVAPVSNFLRDQLKNLEKRKKEVTRDDPFTNADRVSDNADMADDADEQFVHARSIAIKDQLDRRMIQIRKALTMIKVGKYGICEDCGKMIDTDRLMIEPEATLCKNCQRKREK